MMIFDERRDHDPLGQRSAGGWIAAGVVLMMGLSAVLPGPSAAGQQPRADSAPLTTAKPAAPPAAAPGIETHPITVAGHAYGPDGKPIPGARVYLASLRADYRRLAETVADAEGRYEFREVPLPIAKADKAFNRDRDQGEFQVFGEAEGFGFAWRPEKAFYPRPNPKEIGNGRDLRDPPSRYEVGDPIVLDLRFTPPHHLSGTIVDDRGDPIADARLEIRGCESLILVEPNIVPGWTLDLLNGDIAPPSMKVRRTNGDGRFDFTGLPADCLFRIDVRAKDFPYRSVNATTRRGPLPNHVQVAAVAGEINLTLFRPVEVSFRMVAGDSGLPAPKVLVQAGSELGGAMATTDDQGVATLKLPPGKRYSAEYLPNFGTPYLVTKDEFVFEAKPGAEPIVARLRPAAIVEVTVMDAETGAGIPDVDLWHQDDPGIARELLYFRSWEVANRLVHSDRPRTDARGVLRALVEPGPHRLGVGLKSYPPGYEAVEDEGQVIESVGGETVRLKFAMRKRR